MGFISSFSSLREQSSEESRQRKQKIDERTSFPYVCALFTIALSSGLSVEQAFTKVSQHVPEVFIEPFHNSLTDLEGGRSFTSALIHISDHPELRRLAYILSEARDNGTECITALDSLYLDTMNSIQRDADKAIKKLPVTMLFPLVICILPSFILLGIVPVVAQGIMAIEW